MPRRCTICDHPDHEAIDRAIADGTLVSRIVSVYAVSASAVRRHAAAHLPAQLTKAREAVEVARADDLLGKVAALEADAKRIGRQAEDNEDQRTALMAVRELVRIVELLAKLRGALDERPQVNIHVAPEWREVRQVLLVALSPYPDARVAVAGALAELEAGHAGG
jgi:hypothetical protein